jgi:hypothetical protein
MVRKGRRFESDRGLSLQIGGFSGRDEGLSAGVRVQCASKIGL